MNELISIIVPTLNEHDKIESFLLSVCDQTYRPIEVLIIDGGSTDSTIDSVYAIKSTKECENLQFKIFLEKNFSDKRSVSNARNIGLDHCAGNKILFFDSDFHLDDDKILGKISAALDENPWVGIKVKPASDTWLETQISIDNYNQKYMSSIHAFCGVTKDIVGEKRFDPELGIFEDKFFFNDLGVEIKLIDAFCSRHYPHNYREYKKQRLWYAKTSWNFLKKYPSFHDFYDLILGQVKEVLAFALSLFLLTIRWEYTLIGLILVFAQVIRVIVRDKKKGVGRIAYLLFRIFIGGALYLYGVAYGFAYFVMKRPLSPSRDGQFNY